MPTDIKVPTIGESITEGRISRWLKAEGSYVKRDESVCELETDKATAEVPAPVAGVLKHVAKEGETVAIGAVIGSVDENGTPAVASAAPAPKPAAAPAATGGTSSKDLMLSPAARRAAEEEKVDPASLTGSGRGGRVIKEDVIAAKSAPVPVAAPKPAPAPTPAPVRTGERETREKMTGIRQRIAQRLVESQQSTATLTTFNRRCLTGSKA